MPRNVDPGSIRKGSGLANQNSVDSNSFTDEVIEGQNRGLDAHINDPQDAHPATAISTTGSGGIFFGDNVQENLDELAGLVPARPPTIGNFSSAVTFTGIPDWGRLKLLDGGLILRGAISSPVATSPNQDFFVYGEWWTPPWYAQQNFSNAFGSSNLRGAPFTIDGNDPVTDPTFNVDDVGYIGGGPGFVHAGGFTRFFPVIETARVFDFDDPEIVLSGSVFPADRGVIALFHWPAGGGIPEFLAQPLTERVVAAILCGQGVGGEDCDGAPGGIFSEGDPDAFSFPGRSTGQYDLSEIHLGVDAQTGDPISGGALPGAGQVRLGTDPAAGVPVVPGGIPILGATTAATGGGNDNNFFRYRLPYLDDYTSTTGLEYTPDIQKPRYFTKPAVSLDPGTDLTQAGDYANFSIDYSTFQVCRYRHQFTLLPYGPTDFGSFIMLHFQRETDFEAFARDGIMPDDASFGYDLWSAGMENYLNPESTDNVTDNVGFPLEVNTSAAYHIHRSAILNDEADPVITSAQTFTYVAEFDETMYVSGVQHFLPNGSGVGTNWQIDTLTWSATGVFSFSYLLGWNHVLPEITPGMWHNRPGVLYLGAGTAESSIVNGAGPGYTGTSEYQRVDFDYSDFGSVSGPFDLSSGPTGFSTADIVLTGGDTPISFDGDEGQCHFWFDARVRLYVRKPLDVDTPASPGTEVLFANPGGDSILIHTTAHSPSYDAGPTATYGNFKTTTPGDFPPRVGLETSRKDIEERFYDEVYRYLDSSMISIDPSYNAGLLVGNLVGPGLPFPALPIQMPVPVASEPLAGFGIASYLRTDAHLASLTVPGVDTEAQVSGLPDRNPPASGGVANPCPFSGMLIYPQIDYTTGFRPASPGDISVAQPDYSGVVDAERVYLRVFDAAYSNDGVTEPAVVGQPFLTFRIDGLELADIAYDVSPGPGNAYLALEIKIPGLTTWMDMGRPDMAGPSKQDPFNDGAGCQIIDPTATFDGVDAVTGTVFCQVRVNVGPAANIFANIGAVGTGVAPVLFRARIKSAGAAYNFTQGGSGATSDTPRALTGVTLLRHSDGSAPTSYGPPTFP